MASKKFSAVATVALCGTLLAAAPAMAQDEERAFRARLGLTMVTGMSDLEDAIVANNRNVSSATVSPIGLSAVLAFRVATDVAVAGSIGPIVLGMGDASFTIVPVGISGRFAFARSEGGAPFVRAGVEQAIADGDFVETGSAGFVLALGYEFGDGKRGGWGIELAYRTAEVDVPGRTAAQRKTVQPYKGSVTAYWAF